MNDRGHTMPALSPTARAAGVVVGLTVFVVGVAAVFWTPNDAGAAALVGIGAVAIALALLGDRIQSLGVGGATLTLRDAARETLELAARAEERGDEQAAGELRTAGRELRRLASAYRMVRSGMSASTERTAALDALVEETAKLAKQAPLDPDDVSRWYEEGSPEARITAIGLMLGDARLRDFAAAFNAITHSRSAFEQYWGLVLAMEMAANGELRPFERPLLREAVEAALRSRRVRQDPNRVRIARQILEAIDDSGVRRPPLR